MTMLRRLHWPRNFGVLAVGWLILGTSLAGVQSGNATPEPLKDLKRAGGACLREDALPSSTSVSDGEKSRAPDLSCAIAPSELASTLGKPETVVIDARSAEDHAVSRLNGALHTSVAGLRAKSYLHEKTLVMIGNGKAERELYVACAGLKAQGFKQVRVLRGGVPAWLNAGQAVLGQAPDVEQSTRLAASELWIETQFESNLVLVTRSQEAMMRQLPLATVIADVALSTVKSVIERWRKELKNAPISAVVLVTAPTTSAEALQRLRQAIQPIPLLVYADTPEAYAGQLAQQKAVWTAQARGPKRPACGL